MPDSRRLATYLILYILIQTFQFQFAKNGLNYVDPLTFMGLRYLIAGVVCFAIARTFRPIVNRDTILLSFFTFLSSGFWAVGLEYVSPAQSAVISYSMPLFAIPLSIVLLKEHPSGSAWMGAIVGFIGVAVYGLALTSSGGSLLGVALSLGNALFWGLYSIYYRRLMSQDPVRTVASQFIMAGLMYFPFVPFTFFLKPTPFFFIDLGYASLIGGVLAFITWNLLVRMDTIGKITTLVFAVPATSLIIESILTDQFPAPLSILGVGIIFSGIYISRLKMIRRKIPRAEQLQSQKPG